MADRTRRLVLLSGRRLEAEDVRLGQWRRLLGAYDYRRQLERGYSVTRDAGGTVVRSTHDVEPGSVLFTHVVDGEVVSTVADPLEHIPAAGAAVGATRPDGKYGDGDEGNT
jgi:exonuclease VII large subunit